MCPNDLYSEDYLEEVCIFTRELVRRTLLERMEAGCEKRFGKELGSIYHFEE